MPYAELCIGYGKRARYAGGSLHPRRGAFPTPPWTAQNAVHTLHRQDRCTLRTRRHGLDLEHPSRNRWEETDRGLSLRSDERSRSPESVFTITGFGVQLHRNAHPTMRQGRVSLRQARRPRARSGPVPDTQAGWQDGHTHHPGPGRTGDAGAARRVSPLPAIVEDVHRGQRCTERGAPGDRQCSKKTADGGDRRVAGGRSGT